MLVALPISRFDSPGQESLSFAGAIVLRESLRVHLIAGNIIGIGCQQRFEMQFGGDEIAFAETFQGDAVAGKRIVGVLREKLFQFLAAGFVLFRHNGLAYYTWRATAAKGAA